MRPVLRYAAIAMVVFTVFFNQSHAGSNRVQVHKDRLTVHVKGMVLEDLFETLAEATGIQFIVDEELARTAVSLDFEGLPLLDGIKKILSPLNHAMIEDDSGKLSRVFVFGQGKASVTLGDQREAEDSLDDLKPDRSEEATSEREKRQNTPPPDQTAPEENEPAYFEGPPTETVPLADGPPDSQDQQFDGPPETKGHQSDGPPDVTGTDNPPPESSDPGEMEGPPQD